MKIREIKDIKNYEPRTFEVKYDEIKRLSNDTWKYKFEWDSVEREWHYTPNSSTTFYFSAEIEAIGIILSKLNKEVRK